MKKIYNKAKQHRSFRRYVKKLFASFIKHQNRNDSQEIEWAIQVLLDVKESINIIADEITRQLKAGK